MQLIIVSIIITMFAKTIDTITTAITKQLNEK